MLKRKEKKWINWIIEINAKGRHTEQKEGEKVRRKQKEEENDRMC